MDEQATALIRKLTEEGKLIEAGWLTYRHRVMPATCGQVQVTETRTAFFAAAQYLFTSLMTILEPDAEPTENDVKRIDAIAQELKAFELKLRE